jgi:signal transduction histidine kinase
VATLTHRYTAALAAALLPTLAQAQLAGVDGITPSGLLLPALWLLALGWIFLALLRRWQKAEDRTTELTAQLAIEQKTRLLAEHALADAHAVLSRLVREQDQVRENERSRIARDIHDDLGQNLLALRIDLSLMQVAASGIHPAIHQKAGAMAATLELAVRSLRAVIDNLRPLALAEGLRPAIERQLREFSRISGIRHEFEVQAGAFDGLAPQDDVDAMLYRVVQESLSNVTQHAQATEVRIAVARDGNRLTLRVEDNGIGIGKQARRVGRGIAGMRERASAAGARFAIDSVPGAGTTLSVTVPLEQRAALH